MEQHEITISFDSVSTAEANRYAESLSEMLREAHNEVTVKRAKADPTTMDLGATLVLVLGAPATIAAARALRAWLTRHNAATLKLDTPKGTVTVTNAESNDLANIVRALTGEQA